MGIIKQGILGGFSNKVGSVVGSSWKGIATMRAMPLSVANPRTTAQVNNRSNFSLFSKMGSSILPSIIQPLFNRWAKKMSGYNEWVSINKLLYEKIGNFNGYIQEAVFADGDLSSDVSESDIAAGGVVSVDWSGDLVSAKDAATDTAYIVVAEFPTATPTLENMKLYGFATGVARSATHATASIGSYSAANTYIAYLMFRSADGVNRSNTSSLTVTKPA